jgi:hypothetical protein
MTPAGSVVFEVTKPQRFGRGGVPLRVVILTLFFLPGSINWLASLFYLPITTAVLVHQKGSERFFDEDARRVTDLLRWIVGIYSYFAYLTDDVSLDAPESTIRFEVERGGTPTTGSALRRIATSLPNIVVFGAVGILALGVWLIAGLSILVTGNYPKALWAYQCGVNRWQARLFSYHTSLVDSYPPFRLSAGSAAGGTS